MGQRKQWGHVKAERVAPREWKIPHSRQEIEEEEREEARETERKIREVDAAR